MAIVLRGCTDNLSLFLRLKIAFQLIFRLKYDLFLSEKSGRDLFNFFIKTSAEFLIT